MKKKILLIFLLTTTAFANNSSFFWDNYFFSLKNNIITLPEYIATYLLTISGYFFSLLIIFQIVVISYKYLTTGFDINQLRQMVMNFALSSAIVIALIFTPGVKKVSYNESDGQVTVKTKLVVDMVSSLFASGSRIADLFSYELLFGCITCGSQNVFTGIAQNAPKKDTVLNGFLFKSALGNMALAKSKLKVQLLKQNKEFTKLLENLKNITSLENLKKYEVLINKINSSVNNLKNSSLKETTFNKTNYNKKIIVSNYLTLNINGNITDCLINNGKITDTNIIEKNRNGCYKKELKVFQNYYINNIQKNILTLKDNINNDLLKISKNDYYINNQNQLLIFLNNFNEKINMYFKTRTITQPIDKIIFPLKNLYNNVKRNLSSITNILLINNINDNIIKGINSINYYSKNDLYKNDLYSEIQINVSEIFLDLINGKKAKEEIKSSIVKNFINLRNIRKEAGTEYRNNIIALQKKIEAIAKKNNSNFTLNDLYQKSNLLDAFKVLPFIKDSTIDEMVKKINLDDDYEFHWYDLGKYFMGIKELVSKNNILNELFNKITYNSDLTVKDQENLLHCLQLSTDLAKKDPICTNPSFNFNKNIKNLENFSLKAIIPGAAFVGGLSLLKESKKVKGKISLSKKGLLATAGKTGSFLMSILGFMLTLLMITLLLNNLGPLLFWYIGVINWFFKSSILLISFCFSIVFLILDNRRQQVINNVFLIIGQAMVPVFMVGMFFLIVNMSIVLDVTIFQAIPLGNLLNTKSDIAISFLGMDLNLQILKYMLHLTLSSLIMIILLIMNFSLYRYLWQVDEFVSEVMGTSVNNTIIQPERVMSNFSLGAGRFIN